MANNNKEISDFYCTQCGKKGLPVVRSKGQSREPGHLKKMYCPYCKVQNNMAEVRPFGQYKYKDFLTEFTFGNFTPEGLRIDPSWRRFVSTHEGKELIKNDCVSKN